MFRPSSGALDCVYSLWYNAPKNFFGALYHNRQTETFTVHIMNWLVFITVVESVYSAIRIDSLYKADYVSLNSILNQRPNYPIVLKHQNTKTPLRLKLTFLAMSAAE